MGLICNPTLHSLWSLSVGLIGYSASGTDRLTIADRWQLPYLDVGLTQVKVTPLEGRSVPFSNSVCTAAGQMIVQ